MALLIACTGCKCKNGNEALSQSKIDTLRNQIMALSAGNEIPRWELKGILLI
jgi:hypothetical protein